MSRVYTEETRPLSRALQTGHPGARRNRPPWGLTVPVADPQPHSRPGLRVPGAAMFSRRPPPFWDEMAGERHRARGSETPCPPRPGGAVPPLILPPAPSCCSLGSGAKPALPRRALAPLTMAQERRDRRATCLGSTETAAALRGLALYNVRGRALGSLRGAHWHGVRPAIYY